MKCELYICSGIGLALREPLRLLFKPQDPAYLRIIVFFYSVEYSSVGGAM